MRSGLVAEFESADALERAHATLTRRGFSRLDTWTPYAPRALVRGGGSVVAWIMLVAGLAGGGLGYLIQWWVNVHAMLRVDVGGRPLHSAPAFIPITFESAVLASAVTGFVAMLWLSRLPRLHHPIFEVEGFERASVDRFWLGVDDDDPALDDTLGGELTRLGALRWARLEAMP